MKKNLTIFTLVFIILFQAGGALAQNTFRTRQDTIPVLIGKENNPVLRINIPLDGIPGENQVIEIAINLSGTTLIGDVESLSVFYTGKEEAFNTTEHFGTLASPGMHVRLRGNQDLDTGNNYFWVSIKLDSKAALSHRIAVGCESVVLQNGVKLSPPEKPAPYSHRIGIALRKHGDDKVHTYRIPGLVTSNKGTLIAVYDIRRNGPVDLQADVDVGMSRSTDGGLTWEPMKIIMDMGEWGGRPQDENGIGDPSILVDRTTGTIWVAAVWAHGTPGKRNWFSSRPGLSPSETSQFMVVRSDDDGLSWSPPINLTTMLKDPEWYLLLQGPGSGITLSDGTLVFPAQFKDEQQLPHSTIVWSRDHGETWNIGTGAKANTTEAQVIELDDGSIMLNMRDNRKGSRSVYTTDDLGSSWNKHHTSRSALIEPVCNAALIKGMFRVQGEEKSVVLFANPNSVQGRHHMTIKASLDDGNTWPEEYWLLLDMLRGRGYPNMTRIDDRHVGILYEGSQADLVFERISLDEILHKDDKTGSGAGTGAAVAGESPFFDSLTVFKPLSDGKGYHNYRIPSLIRTKNNVLLAMAEGREDLNLDHAKNDLVLMRSTDGGDSWEDPVVIAEAGDNVTMNPVLVQAGNGMVILSYIFFPEKYHTREMSRHGVKLVEPGLNGDHIQRFFVITSDDDGVSWSEPRELTMIVKKESSSLASICGPGTGIVLTRGAYRGRVIIPMQEQIMEGKKKENYLYALYSDDHGNSWKHGEFAAPDEDGSGGEVQMVELSDGSLMLSARNSSGFRRVAFSEDGGHSWSKLKKEKALADTGCMSPLLRYRWPDGNDSGVIVHVGVTDRVEGRRRGRAVLCLSYDDGQTWPLCRVIHEGTFDYSSLAILPDGSIGMLAEYDFDGERAKIKLARFNLQWIERDLD